MKNGEENLWKLAGNQKVFSAFHEVQILAIFQQNAVNDREKSKVLEKCLQEVSESAVIIF